MLNLLRLQLILACLFVFQVSFAQKLTYEDSVNSWYRQRIIDLKAPDGWVNLAGLFWLEKGKNTLGSGNDNSIKVNHPDMPTHAGTFEVAGDEVRWTTHPGSQVLHNNAAITSLLVYSSSQSSQPQLAIGSLRMNIIIRGDKTGIRLRDLQSAAIKQFKAPARFPINQQWKIKARFKPSPSATIAIQNVLGQVNRQASPGQLVFTYQKKTYQLDVLNEGDQWFVLFADATSGKTTYPTGRFLYVPKNKEGEEVYLDFNLAFNPPCAFTNFATCPLPPPQNRLPFAIIAGEKYKAHAMQ